MQRAELNAVFAGVRPGGCAEPHLQGFAAELISTGYALHPARDYVRAASHLGRWLDSMGIGVDRLNESTIADFAQHE